MADEVILETVQAEGQEAPQPQARPKKQRRTTLSKDQLQALVDTMYNADKTSISREELDSILENPDIIKEITFAYHSITGGLSFIDEERAGVSTPVLTLKGNGEINTITPQALKDIIDNYPEHGETLYKMFQTGELTMEKVAITDHLYASNFTNQANNFFNKFPTLQVRNT